MAKYVARVNHHSMHPSDHEAFNVGKRSSTSVKPDFQLICSAMGVEVVPSHDKKQVLPPVDN